MKVEEFITETFGIKPPRSLGPRGASRVLTRDTHTQRHQDVGPGGRGCTAHTFIFTFIILLKRLVTRRPDRELTSRHYVTNVCNAPGPGLSDQTSRTGPGLSDRASRTGPLGPGL
ncbi:hypothetical protein EYF80_043387 [Liparis tanakae]|uniref:Uncharacterized protein n=1 Tax=Liparis tanakae TaxID=230148 RepID=A0A4Z2FZK5_9TELE|nr:hypothetical protein EYF80_043387 [Liparis tanakae]